MKIKHVMMAGLILAFNAQADEILNAALSSAAVQAVNIGVAIYMRNQGMQPTFTVLPNGMSTVVPTLPASINTQSLQGDTDLYQFQNQQYNKKQFMYGS